MYCRTTFQKSSLSHDFILSYSRVHINISSRICPSFPAFQVLKPYSQLYSSKCESTRSPNIVPFFSFFFFFHLVTLTAQRLLIDWLYAGGNDRTSTTKALCFFSSKFSNKEEKKAFWWLKESGILKLKSVPQTGNILFVFFFKLY